MDTNQRTANNYQVNTFTKGMNSDTSYDMIGADQYLFGQNIRITNNTLLFGDIHQNYTEGSVTPVYTSGPFELISLEDSPDYNSVRILAAKSIGNIGAVILGIKTNESYIWKVFKIIKNGDGSFEHTLWYEHAESDQEYNPLTFSIVLHRETSSILNLYIADGVHSIVQMNLEDANEDGTSKIKDVDINYLTSGRLLPTDKIKLSKTLGELKTQQLQYTYRLYKKHGTTTKLSPKTHKIQIIDFNRNKEQGNAKDTRTSTGLELSIAFNGEWLKHYDSVQVYRISYIEPNNPPEIYLIYDGDIHSDFKIVDKGNDELQKLSLDEFSALDSQIIIPQSIESNQGYLFSGNIKDETVIQFTDDQEEDIAKNVVRAVYADVPIYNVEHAETSMYGIIRYNPSVSSTEGDTGKHIGGYFNQFGIQIDQSNVQYNDNIGSSLLRSLRRDEEYRYGVVYYDKYGAVSNVYRIGIEVETEVVAKDLYIPQSEIYYKGDYGELYAVSAGVECTIKRPSEDIIGFQIVRCSKTNEYTKNILQAALSRPSMQGLYDQSNYRTPMYPNVYMTTQFLYILYTSGYNGTDDLWTQYFDKAGTNVQNFSLYQIFSPEINIRRTDVVSDISGVEATLNPIRFLYDNRSLDQISLEFELTRSEVYTPGYVRFCFPANKRAQYPIERTTKRNFDEGTLKATHTEQLDDEYFGCVYIPSGYTFDKFVLNGQEISRDSSIGPIVTYEGITYRGVYTQDPVNVIGESSTLEVYVKEYTSGSHIIAVKNGASSLENDPTIDQNQLHKIENGVFLSAKMKQQDRKEEKSSTSAIINLYTTFGIKEAQSAGVNIKNIKDVKNTEWNSGFSSIQLGDDNTSVVSAVKQYKSYMTTIGQHKFVNWVANGMYNLEPTKRGSETQLGNRGEVGWVYYVNGEYRRDDVKGWIGPGPVSLLIDTDLPARNSILRDQVSDGETQLFGTVIANISHNRLEYNDQYTPYYGFGNFFEFDKNPGDSEYGQKTCIVFDGDIYITPAEFTNMFKTYDFNDQQNNLISGQVVYYIPLESRINTFFDYGMNYRNTSSTNLMLEPGEITGIATQARPLHQYNMIYSENNSSIDVFTPHVKDDEDIENHLSHRICYSQLKIDGENIDNWQIFRPADYIDTDSKYAEITHLLTSDNILYYWQNSAFGKLSVNERSLVKDENSNTIQLGTGGVLNRFDYLSTRYGMKFQHHSAIDAENGIYWIDFNNRAVVAYYGNNVLNYSEACNVQNITNNTICNDQLFVPTIYYDLQNNELLCGINRDIQLVFNLKLNCATSIYNRPYDICVDFTNVLYSLKEAEFEIKYRQLNYIKSGDDKKQLQYPVSIQFVVNQLASLTKVYDNQKIILQDGVEQTSLSQNQSAWGPKNKIDYPFLQDKLWSFSTDYKKSTRNPEAYRDTENNVWYSIPRVGTPEDKILYGDRLRGKWLSTTITDNNPREFAISHIITKFRQSYN